MLNQTILVGRLTKDPELLETDNGKKRTSFVLAVSRQYKNTEGTYDTDFIRCILWNNIAAKTCDYCKKGDIVGIKGRLETSSYEKDGEIKYSCDVIAEKVTFLSSRKQEEAE
ncbi:MAG: single-stranded DNA-binding protein [Bacilli bacterium]|nr:single-stranded DNA-binding protein [Bacilli bacterium]